MSDIESTSSCVEQTLEHDGRQCDRKAISDSDSIVGTVPSGQDAVQGQNAERARNKPWAKIKRFFRSAVKRKDSSAMREMSPVNNGELTIGPSAEGSIGNGHLEQLGITLAHGQDIVQDRETERAKNKPWAKIKRFCRFTVKRKDSSDKHENSVTGENGPTVHRPAGNGEDPEHPSVEGSEKPASNGHLDVPESESKVTSLNDDEVETVAVEDRSARRSKIETWRKIQRFCRSVVKCSGDTGENPFRSVARPNSSLAGKGEEPEIMFVERLHEPATNSRLAEQKCEPENVVDKVGRDHSRSLENISAKNENLNIPRRHKSTQTTRKIKSQFTEKRKYKELKIQIDILKRNQRRFLGVIDEILLLVDERVETETENTENLTLEPSDEKVLRIINLMSESSLSEPVQNLDD